MRLDFRFTIYDLRLYASAYISAFSLTQIFNKKLFIALLFTAVYGLWTMDCHAQTKTQQEKQNLEKERQKLLKDIELTKKLLDKTTENKKQTLSQLETLQKQIEIRQRVIANLNKEIRIIENEIKETDGVVAALQKDLEELKKRYAEMVTNAYKNRTALNEIVFVFSSKNFNDAFQRIKLIQTLNQFRQKQAEMIEETRKALSNKVEDLKAKKTERMKLLNAEIEQRTELSEEKQEQNKIAHELKKKEKSLADQIKKKQADAERLNKKIEEIIRKEIEAAKKKAEEEAKAKNKPAPATSAKGTTSLSYTPEAAKLSADFQSNQGKLPWPVEKGIITRGFGQQSHPVLKSVIINNNGVDIKTEKNAKARCIFEGSVVSVITVPGMQKAVMIRHGEFFSVYSNLDEVFVKAGDKVTTKQELGIIHTNEEEDKTEVHFELWRGTEKMNPSSWISK